VIQTIGRRGHLSAPRTSSIVDSTILPNLHRLSIVSRGMVYSAMVITMLEELSSARMNEGGFHLEVF
jgi:hypothetical protein